MLGTEAALALMLQWAEQEVQMLMKSALMSLHVCTQAHKRYCWAGWAAKLSRTVPAGRRNTRMSVSAETHFC